MFEEASRRKLRFDTPRGPLATEDLWDLPLTQLDSVAIGLSKQLKETETESFIRPRPSTANSVTELKFKIAKHVIEVRQAEQEAAKVASQNREKRERIQELIAKKKEEHLTTLSVEELEKLEAEYATA